jgi:phospholipase B1
MNKLLVAIFALAIFVNCAIAQEIDVDAEPSGPVQRWSCGALPPSNPVPTSVHMLRPGDIKVIGAIGDSLTAANGAGATTVLGLITEFRGLSWCMGGQTLDVDKSITLPNILRKYNPSLIGYSTGSGTQSSANAKLNVAYPGKTSHDMLEQAQLLISRMKTTTGVNFNNDWKLITFFIGGNDLCDTCNNPTKYSAENFVNNLRDTLDYFKANLPRALINLVMTLDVSLIVELNGAVCRTMQNLFCDCGLAYINQTKSLAKEYQARTENLVASGRYDNSDTFTVVLHKFMKNVVPPKKPNNESDLSYFAPDCFHFSEKGHQTSAVELWNSMMSPNAQKREEWNIGDTIKCPTAAAPYIYTNQNSRMSLKELIKNQVESN